MFEQAYQSGFISLLSSVGSKPLQLWEKHDNGASGAIARVLDDAVQSAVIQIGRPPTADEDADVDAHVDADADALVHTWLRCPAPRVAASLHLRLPQLVVQLRPCLPARHCSIEVQVEDHTHTRRRLRASTFQRATVVHERLAALPLALEPHAWNQLQLNLPALVRAAYGTRYVHTVSVRIHAHCRVRRVFLVEHMRAEQELPLEFRLFRRLNKAELARLKAQDDQDQETKKDTQRMKDKTPGSGISAWGT